MTTLQEAIHQRKEGNYAQSKVIFEALITAQPDDALVNYHYAWLHDNMGDERGAVPYYERALANADLPPADRRGALLGLGSTYRTLGQYAKAAEILRTGRSEFPDAREFTVFYAMTLYNLGQHQEAMRLLLLTIVETTEDNGITSYVKAIRFYAEDLDKTW